MSSRPFVDITFGPYLPDLGGMPSPDIPGYLTDAVGVRFAPVGWRSTPTFTPFGVAVGTAGPMGTSALVGAATEFLVIADSTLIYNSLNSGSSWTNRSPSGGGGISTYAQILEWYDGTTLSTLLIDINGMFYKTSGAAANFVTLPGTLFPTGNRYQGARYAARIQQHLVLGYLNTGFDTGAYTVYWPAIGSFTDWPIIGSSDALAKQSGAEEMDANLGPVAGILGGEKFGIVVQTNGLTRMTYTGGATVFEFDTYEKKRGAGIYSTALGAGYTPFVQTGPNRWIWINEQGVHETDGYSVSTLSSGAIEDALFLALLSHPDAHLGRAIRGAYDERRGQVVFRTDLGASSDHHLVFDTRTRSFSFVSGATYHVLFTGPIATTDYKNTIYSAFTDRKLYQRTAGSGDIALQTGYMELVPGNRVQITGAHLLGSGVPGSLTLSYKATSDLGSVDVAQTGFTVMTAPTRGMKAVARVPNNQFHSFRIAGTASEAQLIKGIRVYYENAEPAT